MRENKYKVLQVHNYYQIPGGEDTVVANEKKLLEMNGHKVIQYTRSNNEIKDFSILKKLFLPVIMTFNLKTYRNINEIIKNEKIEIIHVHNTLNIISPSVYYAAKKNKIPVIQTIHNFRLICLSGTFFRNGRVCEECIDFGMKRAIKYGCYRNSIAQTMVSAINTWFHRKTGILNSINYICLTEFNVNKLKKLKYLNNCRFFVKPNFIVDDEQMIIPYKERDNTFIYVGRLENLKGIDLLLKAWNQLEKEEKTPCLLIVGTGPREEQCKEYIAENKMKNVKLLGFVDNCEVKKLIAKSKALILPTQCYEGFPMTIVESYSVGTPVIGSSIGNCGNLIINGLTGLKIDNKSPDDLVHAVKKIIQFYNISDTTYLEYKEKYTDIRNYQSLKKIYDCIVESR